MQVVRGANLALRFRLELALAAAYALNRVLIGVWRQDTGGG